MEDSNLMSGANRTNRWMDGNDHRTGSPVAVARAFDLACPSSGGAAIDGWTSTSADATRHKIRSEVGGGVLRGGDSGPA